jgi:hypothetical protein
MEKIATVITHGELLNTIANTRAALWNGRILRPQSLLSDPATKQAAISIRNYRNELAHTLSLVLFLKLIDEEPKLELDFNALFGLSSGEAKALLKFDEAREFHVEEILTHHAQL